MYGYSKVHLRKTRTKLRLTGLVEVHHVIPRTYSNCDFLKSIGYDTEASYNLVFCPSKLGHNTLNIRESRPIHTGGHMKYNAFVKKNIDVCDTIHEFYILWLFLHMACRGWCTVPWK